MQRLISVRHFVILQDQTAYVLEADKYYLCSLTVKKPKPVVKHWRGSAY